MEVLKQERVKHNGKSNFGVNYSTKEILTAGDADVKVTETPDWIEEAARLLSEGAVIAWFQGGCEFGPRALGYRSILADPRTPGIKDFINREIKDREDFRPFAPAVPREDCTKYFKYDWDSPYMILVNPVKPEWAEPLANVVHLNGTARVQTITPEMNEPFYRLLKAFEKLTGISVLLNTSLNRRGMPIIETPEQAMEFFKETPLDYLVFEDCIVAKANEPKYTPAH
jgi:carbamoyltransferase